MFIVLLLFMITWGRTVLCFALMFYLFPLSLDSVRSLPDYDLSSPLLSLSMVRSTSFAVTYPRSHTCIIVSLF